MGIEDKIITIEDNVVDMKPAFVVYGAEGVGKTTFASYAPNPLFVDVEGGRSSILKTENRPKVLPVDDISDLSEVFIFLKSNPEAYDSVVIDTITEVEKLFLMEIVEDRSAKDPNKDPNFVTQNDYGRGSTRMRKMIRKFRSLDMITIFLAHEREDKDDRGIIKKGPAVMPSVMKDINAFCDFIFNMGVDNDGVRKLVTSPTKRIRAKHRIGDLPNVIELGNKLEDSSFMKVLDMINKTKKSKKGDK